MIAVNMHILRPPRVTVQNSICTCGKNRPSGFCPKMGQAFLRELAFQTLFVCMYGLISCPGKTTLDPTNEKQRPITM